MKHARIPARLLRKVNPGEILDLVHEHAAAADLDGLRRYAEIYEGGALDGVLAAHIAATEVLAVPRTRPGRSGHGLEHYAVWATRYVEQIEGNERHPVAALAREHHKELGRTQAKAETYIRDTIADARRRYGLLTRPGPSRAGGLLTPKAQKILAEMATRKESDNG